MAEYMLTLLLARDFSSAVRHRGLEYFRARRVKIRRGDDASVEAVVRGTGVYEVTMRQEAGALYVTCTCPYFGSDSSCKHLWAVVLTAQAEGYLRAASRVTRLIMMDDDGDEFGDDDGEFELTPPPARVPDWRRRVTGILGQATEYQRPQRGSPAGTEILYAVDVQASRNASGMVMTLHVRTAKPGGEPVYSIGLTSLLESMIYEAERRLESRFLGSHCFVPPT